MRNRFQLFRRHKSNFEPIHIFLVFFVQGLVMRRRLLFLLSHYLFLIQSSMKQKTKDKWNKKRREAKKEKIVCNSFVRFVFFIKIYNFAFGDFFVQPRVYFLSCSWKRMKRFGPFEEAVTCFWSSNL